MLVFLLSPLFFDNDRYLETIIHETASTQKKICERKLKFYGWEKEGKNLFSRRSFTESADVCYSVEMNVDNISRILTDFFSLSFVLFAEKNSSRKARWQQQSAKVFLLDVTKMFD